MHHHHQVFSRVVSIAQRLIIATDTPSSSSSFLSCFYCTMPYQINTHAIQYINWRHLWSIIVVQFFYLAYLRLTARVCYNCFNLWLNNIKFLCRNNRHLWLKFEINNAPLLWWNLVESVVIHPSRVPSSSSFFTSEVYRILCVKPGYHLVWHHSNSEALAL